MSKRKNWFLVRVFEWGEDQPPMYWGEVEELRNQSEDWEIPTIEDFEDAKKVNLKGFFAPTSLYWASGSGDAIQIVPSKPGTYQVCNRYDVKRRVRLIRRVHMFALS